MKATRRNKCFGIGVVRKQRKAHAQVVRLVDEKRTEGVLTKI
jgi:hypothetical protein